MRCNTKGRMSCRFQRQPLTQEPIAAALAYGFQEHGDKLLWLVYDFGGGTFDAAIIQVRDGVIQVVNHAGDNHLGGKLIDLDIVEKLFVPTLTREYRLTRFERGNEKWAAAFVKLKFPAEQAKIEVCRTREPHDVSVENVWQDDAGQSFDLEYRMTPDAIQETIRPYVTRSLNLCKQALKEKGLSGDAISKVLMVGGTSLIPWLREQVENELKSPLDFHVDPMTVVAQGAAIFAGTQRLPDTGSAAALAGAYRIKLEYDLVSRDDEPEIAGRVEHPKGEPLKGYSLEIMEAKSLWRSGRIPISEKGTFEASVLAEKGRECRFTIDLRDAVGRPIRVVPQDFTYRIGAEFDGATLIKSLGIAMANNQVDPLFKKGTGLPCNKMSIHRTAIGFQRGSGSSRFVIPVVEGENMVRADRNSLVGELEVDLTAIRRDLPAGSEVEITMRIDESRLITLEAHIPILDQDFKVSLDFNSVGPSVDKLRDSLRRECNRLEETRDKVLRTNDAGAEDALDRIDQEQMIDQVERLLSAAQSDTAAVPECETRLLALQVALDQAEGAIEWPALVLEAQEHLMEARRLVQEHGEARDKARLRTLEADLQRAIESRDPDRLRQQSTEVNGLGTQVLTRQDSFWIGIFQHLEEREPIMRDPGQASQLLSQGRRSISGGDVDGLRAVVRQLIALLPSDEQEKARGFGGVTIR
jgi:molecular chaperone DnaK